MSGAVLLTHLHQIVWTCEYAILSVPGGENGAKRRQKYNSKFPISTSEALGHDGGSVFSREIARLNTRL